MWEGLHMPFSQDPVHIPGVDRDILVHSKVVGQLGFHRKAALVLQCSETV